jgi:hypothetical protein
MIDKWNLHRVAKEFIQNLARKPKGMIPLGRTSHRQGNFKIDLMKFRVFVDWILNLHQEVRF